MDYKYLGFMVTTYLDSLGFDGNTDFNRVLDVVKAYVRGYICSLRRSIDEPVSVLIRTKESNELVVYLYKGE